MLPNDTAFEPSRRTVLKAVGGAVGSAGLLSGVGSSARQADGPGGGTQFLEVDEKDMPLERARLWPVNGTDQDVDFYVNYHDQPTVTDVQALSIGTVIDINGTTNEPYGTYTLEVREKGNPDGDILAAASVPVDEGDSFSAVFHQTAPADYQLSVYTNDYSPTTNARVVVRHNSLHQEIDWRFSQNGETPEVPDDPRNGTLQRGQWQEATDVTEANYLFEALVNDEVVTFHRDLEFSVNTTYAVYVVGDPESLNVSSAHNYEDSSDSGIDEAKWILVQAFERDVPGDEQDTTSAPAAPTSTTDQNQHVQFDCEPLELYETNVRETEIGATDPDGIVTGLAIDHVDPNTDGFSIVDNSTDPATSIGGTTTATLRVEPDLPTDSYDVRIIANPNSLGERATCTVPVDVVPIPIARLYDLVDQYQLSEDIEQGIATDLNVLLDDASDAHDAGDTAQTCSLLQEVLDLVGANKDTGVSATAHNDLQTETKAVRQRLGCG